MKLGQICTNSGKELPAVKEQKMRALDTETDAQNACKPHIGSPAQ